MSQGEITVLKTPRQQAGVEAVLEFFFLFYQVFVSFLRLISLFELVLSVSRFLISFFIVFNRLTVV